MSVFGAADRAEFALQAPPAGVKNDLCFGINFVRGWVEVFAAKLPILSLMLLLHALSSGYFPDCLSSKPVCAPRSSLDIDDGK